MDRNTVTIALDRRRPRRPSALAAAPVAGAIALLLGLATEAGARCLPWEPDPVTLVGTLVARDLPGPPGYRSVARGDFLQKVYFVELEAPICVEEDLESSLPRDRHFGIEEVQLSVEETTRGALAALVGRRIRVTGTLFSGNTRHYRTPVALSVTSYRGG